MEAVIEKKLAEIPEDEMKRLNGILAEAMEKLIYRSTIIWVSGKDAAMLSHIIDSEYPGLTYEFKNAKHKVYSYSRDQSAKKYTLENWIRSSEDEGVVLVNGKLFDTSCLGWKRTKEYFEENNIKYQSLARPEIFEFAHPEEDICERCVEVVMTIRLRKK